MPAMLLFARIVPLITLLLFGHGHSLELPLCKYGGEPAQRDDFADWPFTLVDTTFRLPTTYEPPDLVSLREAGFVDDRLIRALLVPDLRALNEAASAAGHPLEVQSAWRSWEYQEQTFQYWVGLQGREEALESSARAGHSEHQLGTVLDFRSAGGPAPWDVADWAATPAGAWLRDNAADYGFVMSYPPQSSHLTCYIYEPWHYRYVGVENARQVRDAGITLREWLWQQQHR